ncbi:MAG TPA: tetratricopeptide repeat protein [Candidatus Babeliales bacterium]|nr:tetratricopeptide repeat protein [Candidatus Babeliales bacterium]
MAKVKSFIDSSKSYVNQNKYTQVGTVVFVFLLLSVGGYFGFSWHRANRQLDAQKAFMDSFSSYGKARSLEFRPDAQAHKEELWDQVDMDFQAAYDQNKSSSLAPYFVMFRAQAMIEKGEVEAGLELMRSVQKDFGSNSPFSSLYKVTAALVELDNAKTATQGLASLKALSEDKANQFADMALYYLGEYYSSQGELQKAQVVWDKIINSEPKKLPEYIIPSPWASLAKMRRGDA